MAREVLSKTARNRLIIAHLLGYAVMVASSAILSPLHYPNHLLHPRILFSDFSVFLICMLAGLAKVYYGKHVARGEAIILLASLLSIFFVYFQISMLRGLTGMGTLSMNDALTSWPLVILFGLVYQIVLSIISLAHVQGRGGLPGSVSPYALISKYQHGEVIASIQDKNKRALAESMFGKRKQVIASALLTPSQQEELLANLWPGVVQEPVSPKAIQDRDYSCFTTSYDEDSGYRLAYPDDLELLMLLLGNLDPRAVADRARQLFSTAPFWEPGFEVIGVIMQQVDPGALDQAWKDMLQLSKDAEILSGNKYDRRTDLYGFTPQPYFTPLKPFRIQEDVLLRALNHVAPRIESEFLLDLISSKSDALRERVKELLLPRGVRWHPDGEAASLVRESPLSKGSRW